jgi:predicted ATPase/class 3 adenylate cyclase
MLFSDVEQSTRLLTRLGQGYERALDGCRSAQRDAWAACGGVEMGTEGDSFFVAFSRAEDAVAAAVVAQGSLIRHNWPAGGQVRVRMGIHTGSPRIHDDGYVGIDVHRAARIAAAAHGGQVVISDVTAKLAAQALPADVSLRDLGSHRLKDLNLPEHLYQLLIPGALADFPPLKSVGTASSLPVATTALVGRRSEVAAVAALVMKPEVRFVTLTGPGGSGRTRLAVATARELVERFPDGLYFVPLAAVTTAGNIWTSIGEAMDLPTDLRTPPAFFGHVAAQHALLVLDNLEQMEGADTAVAALLREAPDLVVLATSRRPLHLTSEHQYAVEPLPLPAADTLEAAGASPAVKLFVDRARAVRSSFALTADNSADVTAICRHLDGLPLAIELAAARSKLLGPRALLARLDRALELRGSQADRPTRQQALHETIDWSYRLLPAPQQVLFRHLGAFAGGADLDALASLAGGTLGDADPVDLVEDLVDASLVTVVEGEEDEPRFEMLETVRAFALDALAGAGDLEDARRAHAAYFAGVAAHLGWREIWATREARIRGNRLFDLELNNFRAALAWVTSPNPPAEPDPSTGHRAAIGLALLAGAAEEIWSESDPAECRQWLEAIFEVSGSEPSIDRGTCLYTYADVLRMQGDLTTALEVAQRSVAMLRTLDATEPLAWALLTLGDIEIMLGEPDASRVVYEEAAGLARRLKNDFIVGNALRNLAFLEMDKEKWDDALRLLKTAQQAFENGGWHYLPNHSFYVARVLRKLGHVEDAHHLMSTALQQEARAFTPMRLLEHGEDYVAALADAGFAPLTPLVLAACNAGRDRMGTPRDLQDEGIIADARAAAEAALTPTEWDDAYARGATMAIMHALNEALASTAGLRI